MSWIPISSHIHITICWGICQRRIVGFDVCIGPALPGCTRHRWKLLQNCNARLSGRVTPENNRVIKACDEVDQQPPYQWWDRLTSGLQTGSFYIALYHYDIAMRMISCSTDRHRNATCPSIWTHIRWWEGPLQNLTEPQLLRNIIDHLKSEIWQRWISAGLRLCTKMLVRII